MSSHVFWKRRICTRHEWRQKASNANNCASVSDVISAMNMSGSRRTGPHVGARSSENAGPAATAAPLESECNGEDEDEDEDEEEEEDDENDEKADECWLRRAVSDGGCGLRNTVRLHMNG